MILEIAQTSESFGIDTIAISNFRAKTFLKHLTNGSTVNQQGRDRGDGQQLTSEGDPPFPNSPAALQCVGLKG
jgi:hypothetical protein